MVPVYIAFQVLRVDGTLGWRMAGPFGFSGLRGGAGGRLGRPWENGRRLGPSPRGRDRSESRLGRYGRIESLSWSHPHYYNGHPRAGYRQRQHMACRIHPSASLGRHGSQSWTKEQGARNVTALSHAATDSHPRQPSPWMKKSRIRISPSTVKPRHIFALQIFSHLYSRQMLRNQLRITHRANFERLPGIRTWEIAWNQNLYENRRNAA